ncbi:MAG: hypothetical protein ACP5UF_01255 [Hydrogenobaculum sp.]
MTDAFSSSWDSDKINEGQWEETAQGIDEYIEVGNSLWALIDIKDVSIPDGIAFLDGIVRLDSEIFYKENKARLRLFSLASGICEMRPNIYNSFEAFKSIKTKKIAIPDKEIPKNQIIVKDAKYDLVAKDQDHLVLLKQLEYESLMDYTKNASAEIIIWDGSLPITFSGLDNKLVFGFIKSHRKYFVSPKNLELLYEIRAFQRTPIIHYTSQDQKNFYYTWYTTLNNDITGLVRIETLANMDIEKTSSLANVICVILRKFASSPLYEERAPQNLAPISALESYLRAYLGYYFFDAPMFA